MLIPVYENNKNNKKRKIMIGKEKQRKEWEVRMGVYYYIHYFNTLIPVSRQKDWSLDDWNGKKEWESNLPIWLCYALTASNSVNNN